MNVSAMTCMDNQAIAKGVIWDSSDNLDDYDEYDTVSQS